MKLKYAIVTFIMISTLISNFAYAGVENTEQAYVHKIEWKPIDRLSSGFSNIIYGPLELVYQVKEEYENKGGDPIKTVIPGVAHGVGWFAAREVVGVFEIVTFFLPIRPHLKSFDTGWMSI